MITKAEAPEAKRILVWRVLLSFQFLDFDELAAVHAGRIRAYLEPRGIGIGPMDTLLAAHALSIGASVVTGNMREFARVPGISRSNRDSQCGRPRHQLEPAVKWRYLPSHKVNFDFS
jgi:tRNA(fMet)-specific endonuclease VapC